MFREASLVDSDRSNDPPPRRNVIVNQEHLKTMTEMGFPENRCKRALKHFNNNLEIALQHVMSTDEPDDDRLFGPE